MSLGSGSPNQALQGRSVLFHGLSIVETATVKGADAGPSAAPGGTFWLEQPLRLINSAALSVKRMTLIVMVQPPTAMKREAHTLLYAISLARAQCSMLSALSCLLKLDPLWWREALEGKAYETRLRQIAGVAGDLSTVEQQICRVLGVEVCYRDKGVAYFGLENAFFLSAINYSKSSLPSKKAPQAVVILNVARAMGATW